MMVGRCGGRLQGQEAERLTTSLVTTRKQTEKTGSGARIETPKAHPHRYTWSSTAAPLKGPLTSQTGPPRGKASVQRAEPLGKVSHSEHHRCQDTAFADVAEMETLGQRGEAICPVLELGLESSQCCF